MLLENESSFGASHNLTNFCDQFCLANSITDPARVTVSSKTLLDFILILHSDHFAASGVSGHDLTYAVRERKLLKSKARITEYQSFKSFHEETLLSDLRAVPLYSAFVFDALDDIWSHWEIYLRTLWTPILQLNAEVFGTKRCPSIQNQICMRNGLYKLFFHLPTNENWLLINSNKIRLLP